MAEFQTLPGWGTGRKPGYATERAAQLFVHLPPLPLASRASHFGAWATPSRTPSKVYGKITFAHG